MDYKKFSDWLKKNILPKQIEEELIFNSVVLDMKDYEGKKDCSYISYKRSEDYKMVIGGFAPIGTSIEDRVGNQKVDWAIQIPVGGDLSQVKIQIYID